MQANTPAGTRVWRQTGLGLRKTKIGGIVTTGRYGWTRDGRVYIRWDGNTLSTGYKRDSPTLDSIEVGELDGTA